MEGGYACQGRTICAQVSRVKRLPIPADSTQLLGKEFVGEEGRGANLIDLFGGAVEACRAVFFSAWLTCSA